MAGCKNEPRSLDLWKRPGDAQYCLADRAEPASEQGVVVRYSQSGATSADAIAAADKFCGQHGRKAVQGDASVMTGDTYISFSCQKP